MSSAGPRPASGARFVLTRATTESNGDADANERAAKEVVYRGFVHLPDADVALDVRVELPSGATKAALTGVERAEATSERDQELAKTAAALVRSATKAVAAAGGPFPRKIMRWRAG